MVNETVQDVARAAHDVGLAAWLGGAMFGKFAHNPSLRLISSREERGKVANAAWNGYNLVNALSLGTVTATHVAARLTEVRPSKTSPSEGAFATAMDVLTGAAAVTGIANFALGAALARQAPEGAVPVETGTVPAPETPPRAARIQRALGVLGTANIAVGVGLAAVQAVSDRQAYSRANVGRSALGRSVVSGRGGGGSPLGSVAIGALTGAAAGLSNEVRRRSR
jgi:hypothetical protein